MTDSSTEAWVSDFSKNEVVEAYTAVTNLGKRALPNMGAILKIARLKTLMRRATEEADSVRLSVAAAAEHIINPNTGQDILKSPDTYHKVLYDTMCTPSSFQDPGFRITKKDLPKLPERSDDAEKDKRAIAAREELANDVAALGWLFDHDAKDE